MIEELKLCDEEACLSVTARLLSSSSVDWKHSSTAGGSPAPRLSIGLEDQKGFELGRKNAVFGFDSGAYGSKRARACDGLDARRSVPTPLLLPPTDQRFVERHWPALYRNPFNPIRQCTGSRRPARGQDNGLAATAAGRLVLSKTDTSLPLRLHGSIRHLIVVVGYRASQATAAIAVDQKRPQQQQSQWKQ